MSDQTMPDTRACSLLVYALIVGEERKTNGIGARCPSVFACAVVVGGIIVRDRG